MKQYTNGIRKKAALCLAVSAMSLCSVQPAFAAASYVTSMSIKVDLELEAGEDVPYLNVGYTGESGCEVTISNNSKYDITSADWTGKYDEASMGDTYKFEVVLQALGGYEFKSSYSSSAVSVKGADFVSAKRDRNDDLVVTLKTKPAKGTMDMPDDVEWESTDSSSSDFGVATWEKVSNAVYDVYLYRESKVIHKVTGHKDTSYDFYPYMTTKGNYTFRVRSGPNSSIKSYAEKSEWEISEKLYVAADEVSDGSGQEKGNSSTPAVSNQNQVGWIPSGGKWFFRYPDGTYLQSSWGKIDNKWYLFGTDGAMLTGWQFVNNKYYYMNPDGDMRTGWFQDKDIWYYLDENGAMKTGWLTLGDKSYYFNESGAMQTGWVTVGDKIYYCYPDGHKAVNEFISGFYVDQNGEWKRP